MPSIKFTTPNARNGQAANTIILSGSGFAASAAFALAAIANGSPVAIALAISADSSGNLAPQTIAIVNTALQGVLSLIGGAGWNDAGTSWTATAADGSGKSVSLTFSVG